MFITLIAIDFHVFFSLLSRYDSDKTLRKQQFTIFK